MVALVGGTTVAKLLAVVGGSGDTAYSELQAIAAVGGMSPNMVAFGAAQRGLKPDSQGYYGQQRRLGDLLARYEQGMLATVTQFGVPDWSLIRRDLRRAGRYYYTGTGAFYITPGGTHIKASFITDAFLTSPGVLGFAFGIVAPWAFPAWLSIASSVVVGYAGVQAPQGSWWRNFSIGAAIGGVANLGLSYGPEIRDTVKTVGDVLDALAHPWETTKAIGVIGVGQVRTWASDLSWLSWGLNLP